jgi:hypothetical protein
MRSKIEEIIRGSRSDEPGEDGGAYMKVRRYERPYESRQAKFSGFLSRWEFVLRRSRGKSVLHLGCIGDTEKSVNDKVQAMLSEHVLHAELRKSTADIVGVDYDLPVVEELHKKGYDDIIYGDVEEDLERMVLNGAFDVVLCGDLIEHLSNPGRMLEGLKPHMDGDSELLVTTLNSFGLLHFLRYTVNGYHEGNDHASSFSVFTLRNLLERHGFRVTEIYTCYNRPPQMWRDRLRYRIGGAFFRLFPKFGGTILLVAKLGEDER